VVVVREPFLVTQCDGALVRALVDEQFPQFRGVPLSYAATGWDNVMFRLGDDYAVRLPRRVEALEPLAREVAWLNVVTEPLSVGFPRVFGVGVPSVGFPYGWAIVSWVEGIRSMSVEPADRVPAAAELGRQLAALHRESPAGAPVNPVRGVALSTRHEVLLQRLEQLPELKALLPVWERALSAPAFPGQPVWCHGDIHPGNYVLGPDARLRAIIDFGDVTCGDPAVDLGTAWASFDPAGRAAFFEAYFAHCAPVISGDSGLLDRARGWVVLATISAVLTSSLSTPDFVSMARWATAQLFDELPQ
jgi:aminoglycoside phosphotransferase (APT) family kinase protein